LYSILQKYLHSAVGMTKRFCYIKCKQMTEIFPFFLFYFGLKLLQRISGLQAILLQFLP